MGMRGTLLVALVAVLAGVFFTSDVLPIYPLRFVPEPAGAFEDDVVVVTGASSGIGAQLARDLCARGARVVLTARRESKLQEVAKSCAGKHEPVYIAEDATDMESHQRVVDKAVQAFGRVDRVVINAGIPQNAVASETPLQKVRDIFELNVFAAINTAQVAIKQFRAQGGGGQITVVSSLAGVMGVTLSSSYSASKFAIQGYFDAVRAEVASEGIRILTVLPGPVQSDIHIRYGKESGIDVDQSNMMPTARCTELMAKAMALDVPESWVSDQPFLLLGTLAQTARPVTRALLNFLGPARVELLKQGGESGEGGDLNDIGTLFRVAMKMHK